MHDPQRKEYNIGLMSDDAKRFQDAIGAFEAAHREDPRQVSGEGGALPWSLHYHRRMRHWLGQLKPEASLALRLAVACQHIRRWTVPRDRYPEGRAGYLRWRTELGKFHAAEAERILESCGFSAGLIARVGELLQKKNLARDPEVQALEDAACLTFLENEFSDFARKHPEEKITAILRKTWSKMSPAGHAHAARLAESLSPEDRETIFRAISG